MSEIRGFQRTGKTSSDTSDFLMVNPDTREEPKKVPDDISEVDSGIYDTFGRVKPILASGEWSTDEVIEARARKKGFFKRLVGLFYE